MKSPPSHAAILRNPSQSLKNSATRFQLAIRFASLKPMANTFRRVAVALGIIAIGGTIRGLATGVLVLGDRFFEVRGTVADCVSGEKLSGATIRADLVRGFGEEPMAVETASNGEFHLLLNEPPSSAAKLTFSKARYETRSEVFDPAPEYGATVPICLEPAL